MASLDTAYNRMHGKIARLPDEDLQTIWKALDDPKSWYVEYGDGIPMQDWAQAVDSELSRRGLPKD